jgi:hypothetical protein
MFFQPDTLAVWPALPVSAVEAQAVSQQPRQAAVWAAAAAQAVQRVPPAGPDARPVPTVAAAGSLAAAVLAADRAAWRIAAGRRVACGLRCRQEVRQPADGQADDQLSVWAHCPGMARPCSELTRPAPWVARGWRCPEVPQADGPVDDRLPVKADHPATARPYWARPSLEPLRPVPQAACGWQRPEACRFPAGGQRHPEAVPDPSPAGGYSATKALHPAKD